MLANKGTTIRGKREDAIEAILDFHILQEWHKVFGLFPCWVKVFSREFEA